MSESRALLGKPSGLKVARLQSCFRTWRALFALPGNDLRAVLILISSFGLTSCQYQDPLTQAAGRIAVQHQGRVKPLKIFAKESLRDIYGKDHHQEDSAVFFLLDTLSARRDLRQTPFVRVDHRPLKEALGLPIDEIHFSLQQMESVFPLLVLMLEKIQNNRSDGRPLTPLEKEAEALYTKLHRAAWWTSVERLAVVPAEKVGDPWTFPDFAQGAWAPQFHAMLTLYAQGKTDAFIRAAQEWNARIAIHTHQAYQTSLEEELFYDQMQPFFWAKMSYFLAFLLLCFGHQWGRWWGIAILCVGWMSHTAGLVLRGLFLDGLPLGNSYESLISIIWVSVVCAIIHFLIMRKYFVLTSGAFIGVMILTVTDILPLNQDLDVLQTISPHFSWLRLYLIIFGYGLLGLAAGIGHLYFLRAAAGEFYWESREQAARMITWILGAGWLILALGMFWDGSLVNIARRDALRDPRDLGTWMTLLIFLILLQGRYAKKITATGMAFTVTVGFWFLGIFWFWNHFGAEIL
jgi:hypothetical protein